MVKGDVELAFSLNLIFWDDTHGIFFIHFTKVIWNTGSYLIYLTLP